MHEVCTASQNTHTDQLYHYYGFGKRTTIFCLTLVIYSFAKQTKVVHHVIQARGHLPHMFKPPGQEQGLGKTSFCLIWASIPLQSKVVHHAYLSTHPVYQYKTKKNHYFLGGYGHTRKWIQENIIFIRFCSCFKLSKKTEKLLNKQLTHAIAKCTLTCLVQ